LENPPDLTKTNSLSLLVQGLLYSMKTVTEVRWSKLKVLITGSAGFIGSHLCRRLCDEGTEVHATSRKQRLTTPGGPVWWQADFADLTATRRVLSAVRPDIVFHLAGLVSASPMIDLVLPTFHSLLASTINVLIGGKEVDCRRIILVGSAVEPGPDQAGPIPSSPYAAAKWAASGYGRMFHSLYQVPVVVLRPFMVYGPAQAPDKLIPAVTLSLLNGEAPKVSSGQRKADWVYVDDVVEALLAGAVTPAIEGATIDLGSGSLVAIRDIVERLVSIVSLPVAPLFGALPDRPSECEVAAATAAAAEMLGWTATTSLEDGLQRTVEWYRSAASNAVTVPKLAR
jgi:nucleoside-diphosphate-sugar epimerase